MSRFFFGALVLMLGRQIAAIEPARYYTDDVFVYVQTAPYKGMVTGLEKFFKRYRGAALGEKEWQMFLGKAQKKLGFSPADFAQLKKMGFDPSSPLAMAIFTPDETEGANPRLKKMLRKTQISILIPASNSLTLWKTYLEMVKKSYSSKQRPAKIRVKTIRRNKIFEIVRPGKPSDLFVARGANYLCVNSTVSLAKSCLKFKDKNLYDNKGFQRLMKKRGEDPSLFSLYYLNNKKINNTSNAIMGTLLHSPKQGAAPKNPILEEMNEYVEGVGGAVLLSADSMKIHVDYFYKEDFFLNEDLWSVAIRAVNAKDISLDQLPTPFAHMGVRMNLAKIIDYFMILRPQENQEYSKAKEEIKQRTGLDLEQDILAGLTGRYSLYMKDLPPEQYLTSLAHHHAFLGVGIKPEHQGRFIQLFDRMTQQPGFQRRWKTTKKEASGGTIFLIEKIQSNEPPVSVDGRPPQKVPPQEPVEYSILVRPKEIIVTGKEELLKELNNAGSKSISEQVLGVDASKMTYHLFLNVESILNYVETTNYKFMAGPYLNFVKPIRSLNIYSNHDNDFETAVFELQLK